MSSSALRRDGQRLTMLVCRWVGRGLEGSGDGCFKGSEEGLGRVLKVALPWFCDVAVYE